MPVVSFTGGVGSLTYHEQGDTGSSLANSKLRPPSYFDKVQIKKVKEISKEVDAAIAHLSNYSLALHEVLDEVDTSNVEGDENFERATKTNTLQGDVMQAVLSMNSAYMSFTRGDKGEKTRNSSLQTVKGTSRGGSFSRSSGTQDDAERGEGLTRWKEAGMTNRPRYLGASFSQRGGRFNRGLNSKAGDGDGLELWQYSSLDQSKDYEETMEGQGRDEASNIDRDVASFVTTPKGQGDAEHGWRTPSYDVANASTSEGGEEVFDESSLSRSGKESQEAQRRQWEEVERLQLELSEGAGSSYRKTRNSSIKRVPPSPAPIGSASPYAHLNMASVKEHAKRRMSAAGGDRDDDDNLSTQSDDNLSSSMAVQSDE